MCSTMVIRRTGGRAILHQPSNPIGQLWWLRGKLPGQGVWGQIVGTRDMLGFQRKVGRLSY
eukprot:5348560-Amphidinium_carterae.1